MNFTPQDTLSLAESEHLVPEREPAPPVEPAVETLIERARAAQLAIERWTEPEIDRLLHALAHTIADHAEELAVATVAETGMGNVRDKTLKSRIASLGIWQQLAGQIGHGVLGFDAERQLTEVASPVGIVVGLVPATHPVATFIFKTLIAIKGRNALILSPSRRAHRVSNQVGALIQDVLRRYDAPVDLVQWMPSGGSRQTTTALMGHRQVGLVLATGGRAMVKAAYSSGRPAIGVGPGNAPVLISADADIGHAARSAVLSKAFDNGLICGAENNLVVVAEVRARLIAELERNGAAVLTPAEAARFLDAAVDQQTRRFKPDILGQDAATLAQLALIRRRHAIRLLVIPERPDRRGELPCCRKACSRGQPVYGRRHGRRAACVPRVARHRWTRPHCDYPCPRRRLDPALCRCDAGQPHSGELARHARRARPDHRAYTVDDAGLRQLGRHLDDR